MADSRAWKKHPSGISYCLGRKAGTAGELLYNIQGTDAWLTEKEFDDRCQAHTREIPRDRHRHESEFRNLSRASTAPEAAGHHGPLHGPGPRDSRLFPGDDDSRESQGRDSSTGQTYEARPRGARLPQEYPNSARQGSTYESGYGTSSIIARTRSAATGVESQTTSRAADSARLSERPVPIQSAQLSPLASAFVGLGLGNYLASSHFISDNPGILAKNEIDALIAEALVAENSGDSTRSQTCIHQALLLGECEKVGTKNIGSFFRKLSAKDGRTKDAFVTDVKKVYVTIQQQAARAPQQNQGPKPESQGRKMPLISQATERPVLQKPYERPMETTQSQTPVIFDRDGRAFYADNQGNMLQLASTRHGSDRRRTVSNAVETSGRTAALRPVSARHGSDSHRPISNLVEMSGVMAGLSISEELGSNPNTLEGGPDNRPPTIRPGPVRHPSIPQSSGPLAVVHEGAKLETTRIGGTQGGVEELDRRYHVRKDAKLFFAKGRVFALLWHESAGGGGGANGQRIRTELSDPIAVSGRFGEEVYSHIRRMVVVRDEHGFCLCLPINTYNGQGVTKPGLSDDDRRAHSVIHMTDRQPYCLPEEVKFLIKKAISVEKASADQALDPMSRLNFKKIYTIEHNVKVMNVGRVTRESLAVLIGYWRNCFLD